MNRHARSRHHPLDLVGQGRLDASAQGRADRLRANLDGGEPGRQDHDLAVPTARQHRQEDRTGWPRQADEGRPRALQHGRNLAMRRIDRLGFQPQPGCGGPQPAVEFRAFERPRGGLDPERLQSRPLPQGGQRFAQTGARPAHLKQGRIQGVPSVPSVSWPASRWRLRQPGPRHSSARTDSSAPKRVR